MFAPERKTILVQRLFCSYGSSSLFPNKYFTTIYINMRKLPKPLQTRCKWAKYTLTYRKKKRRHWWRTWSSASFFGSNFWSKFYSSGNNNNFWIQMNVKKKNKVHRIFYYLHKQMFFMWIYLAWKESTSVKKNLPFHYANLHCIYFFWGFFSQTNTIWDIAVFYNLQNFTIW